MEEEKLAKDINILSKDDTEIDVGMIIKALECCKQKGGKDTCKYCYTCPASVWDFEDGITQCYVDLFQKAINLIYRLQSEKAELQEQVNELTEQNAQLSEMVDYDKGHKEGYEHGYNQAYKDTAKEIYKLLEKWVWKLKNEKGALGKFRFAIETVMQEIKEKYSLEVANFKLVELKKGGGNLI